ncbi:FAD-dependent oxidoreductase [Actinocrispum sp. NPDC049592]|uniref:flavin monoamine oxidase family protein n=1 Tax=Actinocrispum sp. NPDC049592 TaxID=3154835 RepID=UPI00342A18D3
MSHHIDVVVVGAGMAGLACAYRLAQRGINVVVLEACPHIGGRTAGVSVDGLTIDLGGQFIGPGQDRVYALAAELGVSTFPTYTAGANLLETSAGRLRRFHGMVPKLGPLTLLDVAQAQSRLSRLARGVDTSAPWRSPSTLDSQTLQSWIDRTARTRGGRQFLALACQAIWACSPSELSLLHALFYVASAGSLPALTDFEGGAQQDRLTGGASGLAAKLASRLDIHLNAPVRRISQDANGVTVSTEDGSIWRAGHVVVALPPPQAARIAYHPPLPATRDSLTQRLPMGSVIKCVAIYPEPFWRKEGLSGAALSLRGPITLTVDSSPQDDDRGVLLAFAAASTTAATTATATATGATTAATATPTTATGAPTTGASTGAATTARTPNSPLLTSLIHLFGPQAATPTHFLEHNWNDQPFARGAYAALFPPGAWTRLGPALRPPIGRIHWAGTETSPRWYGYIEGAIRSGEAAADAVRPISSSHM